MIVNCRRLAVFASIDRGIVIFTKTQLKQSIKATNFPHLHFTFIFPPLLFIILIHLWYFSPLPFMHSIYSAFSRLLSIGTPFIHPF